MIVAVPSYVFIAPVDSRRTYEPKKSLHGRGKRLPRDERRQLILRRGREDYRGGDFTACERHFDLTLLAFMLLEQYPIDAIAAEGSPVRRRMLAHLRTSKLRAMLERDARREDAAWFARERRSDDGREKIVELFPARRRTGTGG